MGTKLLVLEGGARPMRAEELLGKLRGGDLASVGRWLNNVRCEDRARIAELREERDRWRARAESNASSVESALWDLEDNNLLP